MRPYYDDGNGIVIYHGDAREVLGGISFDVMVTDPPYGIGWKRGQNDARGSVCNSGIQNDGDTSARDYALDIAGNRPSVVFGSFYAPFPSRLKQVLVWAKPADAGLVGSVTGYRRDVEPIFLCGEWPIRTVEWSSVLRGKARFRGHAAKETGHPHTKPVDLMFQLLEACPAGSVVDPFCGSGSTLIAAKRLGRSIIGIELEEKHCETSAMRLAQGVLL